MMTTYSHEKTFSKGRGLKNFLGPSPWMDPAHKRSRVVMCLGIEKRRQKQPVLSPISAGTFATGIPCLPCTCHIQLFGFHTTKNRDVGSISNLGGTTLRGHFFLKEKGGIF